MSTSAESRHARRLTHLTLSAAVAAIAIGAGARGGGTRTTPTIIGPDGATGPSVELSWPRSPTPPGNEVRVDDDPAFATPEWTRARSTPSRSRPRCFGRRAAPPGARQGHRQHVGWVGHASFTVETWQVRSSQLPWTEPTGPARRTAAPVWTPVPGAAATPWRSAPRTSSSAPTPTPPRRRLSSCPTSRPPTSTTGGACGRPSPTASRRTSAARSYQLAPIDTPTFVGPDNDTDITDVVLDWSPVAGARYYELEVDDDFDFSSSRPGCRTDLRHPVLAADHLRQRPVLLAGPRARPRRQPHPVGPIAPDEHYAFDRVWRDVPQPVHPFDASGGLVRTDDDLFFEWAPVPHASHYELWLSPDPNFTEPTTTTVQCKVAGTTFTPGEWPGRLHARAEGIVYYWKVRPMDLPYPDAGVEGIFSETSAVRVRGQEASRSHARRRRHGRVPTLDWAPVPGTEKYRSSSSGRARAMPEDALHVVHPDRCRPRPGDGPFVWRAAALDAEGRVTRVTHGPSPSPPSHSTRPRHSSLSPDWPTFDAPLLPWGAGPGADHYRMEIANALTGNWFADDYAPILTEELPFPAATDLSTAFLDPGTYTWRVSPLWQDGVRIDTRPGVGTFQILPSPPVSGQRLALTGSALDSGRACTKTLADGADQLCDGVPATPVLDWAPVPYASEYRVHVSRDGDFTSGALDTTPPRTVNTRWAPSFDLPRQGAGGQPGPDAVLLVHPALQVRDPVRARPPGPRSTRRATPSGRRPRGRAPRARAGIDDRRHGDHVHLEGLLRHQPSVHLRGHRREELPVRHALPIPDRRPADVRDSPRHQPAWSTSRPTPRRTGSIPRAPCTGGCSPSTRATPWAGPRPGPSTRRVLSPSSVPGRRRRRRPEVSGSVPFRWKAQPFASSYEIQVAAKADRNFSSTNLNVNKTSKRPAYSTGIGVATLQASPTPYVWRVRAWTRPATGGHGPIGEFKVVLDSRACWTPAATPSSARAASRCAGPPWPRPRSTRSSCASRAPPPRRSPPLPRPGRPPPRWSSARRTSGGWLRSTSTTGAPADRLAGLHHRRTPIATTPP